MIRLIEIDTDGEYDNENRLINIAFIQQIGHHSVLWESPSPENENKSKYRNCAKIMMNGEWIFTSCEYGAFLGQLQKELGAVGIDQ